MEDRRGRAGSWQLAGALGGAIMDRPVLDKTGITGVYVFHIKFAHDEHTPGVRPAGMNPFPAPSANVPPGSSLSAVLEQELGLQLVPDRGPHEYLFIDSAARPPEY